MRWLIATAVATIVSAQDGGLPLAGTWSAADWWNDGLAEVAVYDLTQERYGRLHSGGSVTTILIREAMDPQRRVKALPDTDDTVPVIKAHLIRSFPTGVYRYEQAATLLLRRDDMRPERLIVSHHEWCGSAGKSWVNAGAEATIDIHSYFDGHGDLSLPLVLAQDAVLADSLWAWLRAWIADDERPDSIAIVPSQVHAKAGEQAAIRAQLAMEPGPGSGVDQTLDVTVTRGEKQDHYRFEAAFPHRLLQVDYADGTSWTLRSLERFDYWHHRFPEDRER